MTQRIFSLQDLVNEYIKNLSDMAMVYKYMKVWWIILKYSIYAIPIVLVIIGVVAPIYLLVPFLLLNIYLRFFEKRYREVIRVNYNISLEKGEYHWDNTEFDKVRITILFNFLRKNQVTGSKVRVLIDLLNKELDKHKANRFVVPGVAAALSLPVWNAFLVRVFQRELPTLASASEFLVQAVATIFLIVVSFHLVKKFITHMFFSKKIYRLQELIRCLEIISLNISENDNKRSPHRITRYSRN